MSSTKAAPSVDAHGVIARYWPFALLLAVCVAAVVPPEYRLDDPYITMHNARSLLQGADPVYGQNPLVGATSPVHLLFVMLAGLFLPFPNASLVVCVLGTAAYAAGLWRWGWKITIIGLTASTTSLQLFNGLETSLAMAAITWGIVFMDDRRLPYLAGLMPFIRPELGLLSVVLLVRRFLLTREFSGLLIASAVALPFALWTYAATGHLLPNTVAAKLAFFHQDVTPWQRIATMSESANFALITPLLLASPFLLRRRGGKALLVFLFGWLATVYVTFPDALWANEARYWTNAVPILCYALPSAIEWPLLLISIAGAASFQLATNFYNPWVPLVKAAKVIPAGSTVLIHDAGYIAWSRPHFKLVDIVGLKTPRSTEILKVTGARACHWQAALDRIARESHASYLITLHSNFWRCIPANMREAGWRLVPISADPRGFIIYRLDPPAKRPSLSGMSV